MTPPLRTARLRPTTPPQPAPGDDEALYARLCRREPQAAAALFDRHAVEVRALLARILGADGELEDLFQEVFVRAIDRALTLRDPSMLRTWLLGIAVRVAHECITRRRRRWWLRLPGTLPDVPTDEADLDARAAVRTLYAFLDRLPAGERIPFALRKLAGLRLEDVAAVCDLPLSTLRRRLRRAEERFAAWLDGRPALARWMSER